MKKILKIVRVLLIAGVVTVVIGAVFDELGSDEDAEKRLQEYLAGTSRHEYVSSEGKFRAEFPGKPGRATETTEIDGKPVPLTTFAKGFGDAAFEVTVIDVPSGVPYDLDATVNALAAGANGRVERSTRVKVQGFDAVEYVVATPESTFAKGLVIRAPDRVYFVEVVGKANPPPGYDRFKASFAITP